MSPDSSLLFLLFKKLRNLLRLELLGQGDRVRVAVVLRTLDGSSLVEREGYLLLPAAQLQPLPPAGRQDAEPQYEAAHHVLVTGQGKTQGLVDKLFEVQHCSVFPN